VSLWGAPHPAHRLLRRTAVLAFAAFAGGATVVSADESGISFWVPGTYGALAAAPLPQGFSIAESTITRRSTAAATLPSPARSPLQA